MTMLSGAFNTACRVRERIERFESILSVGAQQNTEELMRDAVEISFLGRNFIVCSCLSFHHHMPSDPYYGLNIYSHVIHDKIAVIVWTIEPKLQSRTVTASLLCVFYCCFIPANYQL